MDDVFKPRCPACARRQNVLSEPFGEDASATMGCLTGKTAGNQSEMHNPAG
jgi:hypothetical protein